MKEINALAENIIVRLQDYIHERKYRTLIHFELEGCFQKPITQPINYAAINQLLLAQNIDGQVIAEYWSNQWEYVSLFNGQSPLKEAQNLNQALQLLPKLFAAQGVIKTLIQPVVWAGDHGRLAAGSRHIFSNDTRAVHIPNAIQLNVSVQDFHGNNLLISGDFGERLQESFLRTSMACCLLYLPEEDAFERLTLKSKYGLANELCSPVDISGGHQGSVALYRKLGKHNQKMGIEPLIYDDKNNVIISHDNWQKTARIEHRLGAASKNYSAHMNIIFALLNVIDTIDNYDNNCNVVQKTYGQLPQSLYDTADNLGAISLFSNCHWFSRRIDQVLGTSINKENNRIKFTLGQQLQHEYLMQFQRPNIVV